MKGSRLLLIFIFVITAALGATAIWIGWRLSQEQEVTPETGEAADWCNPDPAGTDYGSPCSTLNATDCGDDGKETVCTNYTWHATGNCCSQPTTTTTGGAPPSGDCDSGDDCNGFCEWPETNFCTCLTGGVTKSQCECRNCSTQADGSTPGNCAGTGLPVADCSKTPSTDGLPSCPSGWTSCGTSLSHDSDAGCQRKGCVTKPAQPCNNPTSVCIYCRESGGTTTTTTSTTSITTTTTIPEGACVCKSITADFSGDPQPGSIVSYTMNTTDENGDPCNVEDVTWSTSPTTLTQVESGPNVLASTHYSSFRVPSDAASGTTYTVSARIGTDPQVGACTAQFQVGDDEVPSFIATKTAQIVCINNNNAAQITYTINVRNISDVSGTIEYIEDTYDSRFQSSWVSNITPSADSHTGNVIRWDNDDAGYTISAGSEMSFSYIVTVPSTYFGTYENSVFVPYEYRNAAIVKPQGVEAIELDTVVEIVCQPGTGILDNAVSASLAALLLIIIGLVGIRFSPKLSTLTETITASYRQKFEKRTLRKIE